jgi:hypothetical protein
MRLRSSRIGNGTSAPQGRSDGRLVEIVAGARQEVLPEHFPMPPSRFALRLENMGPASIRRSRRPTRNIPEDYLHATRQYKIVNQRLGFRQLQQFFDEIRHDRGRLALRGKQQKRPEVNGWLEGYDLHSAAEERFRC